MNKIKKDEKENNFLAEVCATKWETCEWITHD